MKKSKSFLSLINIFNFAMLNVLSFNFFLGLNSEIIQNNEFNFERVYVTDIMPIFI